MEAASEIPAGLHRVLVVDDIPDVAETISQILVQAGIPTNFVCSGADAVDALAHDAFDVVVSDVRMPDVTGIDVLREVKSRDRSAVVVLITGHDQGPLLDQTRDYDGVYVLRKPVSDVELVKLIQNAFLERDATQENSRLRSLIHGLAEVNREADFQRGLDRILALTAELTGASSGSLMLKEGDGRLVLAATLGMRYASLDRAVVPDQAAIAGYVAETGTGLLLDPSMKTHVRIGRLMQRPDIESAMSLPLLHRDRLLGVLNLNRESSRVLFNGRDMDLARLMAEAVTLHVANLLAQARMRRELSERDRSSLLCEFAAGVEHELRNPLTAIQGFAELLHNAPSNDQKVELLGKLMLCVERIRSTVENLRANMTGAAPRTCPLAINELLDETVRFVQLQNPTRAVSVSLDLDGAVGPILGSPTEIMQVFVNLLNNAFQAIPDAGEIRITSRREGQASCVVSVTDNGRGIAPSDQARIFQPFFTTRRRTGGTGLGLSIARSVVDRHGGTIEVESEPGRGTTLRVRLPLL
jgi:signal transduction histidine kinase